MPTLEASLTGYRMWVDAFRWDLPDTFNFGRDVVDRFAADPERPALRWRDATGAERRLTFADVKARRLKEI